jgi:hypothetical protein
VDPQIEASVKEERRLVAAVELDQVVAPGNPAGIARNGDDELEDDIIGQQIEEVAAIGQSIRTARARSSGE